MVKENKFDIAIIGGGPAGLACAKILSKNGLDVVVLEEHAIIGEPLSCGEGISIEKLQELHLPIKEIAFGDTDLSEYVQRKMSHQRFFFADTGVSTAKLDVVTIDRPRFDRYLASLAVKEGTKILTSHSVRKLEYSNKGVNIQVKVGNQDREFEADAVVACDGPASRFTRQVGLAGPKHYVQGVEYKVEGVHTDGMDFYFDFEKFPLGYGWVFPLRSHTNIGIVLSPGLDPIERLNEFYNKVCPNREKILRKIAGIMPRTGPLSNLVADRFLVAGDAGGFTNSIFYGGITSAMYTGILAAKTLKSACEKGDFGEKNLRNYELEVKKMPFCDEIIQEGHRFFYHTMKHEDLIEIGRIFNGIDLTDVPLFKQLALAWRALWQPRMRRKIKPGIKAAKAFGISRDWGF